MAFASADEEARFAQAISIILEHEGGIAEDPADPGGTTNFGISARFLTDIFPALGVSLPFAYPMSPPSALSEWICTQLTQENAIEVYHLCWWDRFGYGGIADARVSTKLFDAAVNMGPPTVSDPDSGPAHELAQEAANDCGITPVPLVVDGLVGPKTIAALNSLDAAVWLKAMCWRQVGYYRALALRKPKLAKFLSNWIRRAAWPFHPAMFQEATT